MSETQVGLVALGFIVGALFGSAVTFMYVTMVSMRDRLRLAQTLKRLEQMRKP